MNLLRFLVYLPASCWYTTREQLRDELWQLLDASGVRARLDEGRLGFP